MNQAKFERFSRAYETGLAEACADKRTAYAYGPEDAPRVAAKILAAIAANPHGVNYDGGGFRRACRALQIKTTRKAIFEFLEV